MISSLRATFVPRTGALERSRQRQWGRLSSLQWTADGFTLHQSVGRAVGCVSLAVGAALLVAAALALYFEPFAAATLSIFGAQSLALGVLFVAMSPVTRVQPRHKVVILPSGSEPFDAFAAVFFHPRIETAQTEHGRTEGRAWHLKLVRKPAGEAVAENPALSDPPPSCVPLRHELVPVLSTPFEHDAWRIGVHLAATLGAPFFEQSEGRLDRTVVEEPSAPLAHRLRDRSVGSARTQLRAGPPPPGVGMVATSRELHLRWSIRREPMLQAAAFMVFAALSPALAIPFSAQVAGLGALSAVVAALFVALIGRGHGTNKLVLDASGLRLTTRWPWPRTEHLSLDAIKAIRPRGDMRGVSIFSDDHAVRAHADPEIARWLTARLLRWVAGDPPVSTTP